MKLFTQSTAALAILALLVLGLTAIFRNTDGGILVGIVAAISGLGGYVLGKT
jgi:hypothetical protein